MNDRENSHNLISLKQAARFCNYHPDHLSRLIREKKLWGTKLGNDWLTTEEAVRNYIEKITDVGVETPTSDHQILRGGVLELKKYAKPFAVFLLILFFSWSVLSSSLLDSSLKLSKENEPSARVAPLLLAGFWDYPGDVFTFLKDGVFDLRDSLLGKRQVAELPVSQDSEESIIFQSQINTLKNEVEALRDEGTTTKEVVKEVSSVTQILPPPKITSKVIEERIVIEEKHITVEPADLSSIRDDISNLFSRINSISTAAGEVIVQTIYQQSNDLRLITLGSGAILLKAAQGVFIQGGAIILDATPPAGSTAIIALRDNVNITGDLTASGELTISGDITLSGGELFLTGIASSSSTTEGTIYYDSDDDNLYVYTSAGFIDLTSQGSLSPFTDGSGITYLTDAAEDFAVGGSTLASAFSIDVSGNLVRVGTGSTANATLALYASDGDTGSLLYNTSDQFQFSGGDVLIDQDATIAGGDLFLTPQASSSSTTEGTIYYDSDDDQLKVYANGKWQSDRTTATLIVAANDSQNKEKADYVGDGTGDDEEIEDAIAALPAGGGVVVLLEGTYSIGTTITTGCDGENGIDIIKSNVSLIGAGRSTILQRGCDTTPDDGVITVGDGGTTAVSGVTIADLAVDGVKGTYAGTPNIGVLFNQKVTYSTIRNTYVHDNDGRGLYLDGAPGAENTNNLIIGNDVRSNDQHGISLDNSDDNIISENNSQSNAGSGVVLSGSDNNTMSGNNLSSNNTKGFDVSTSNKNIISANNIQSSGGDAIQISTVNDSVISNNVIYEIGVGSKNGINISSSDNNIISSNRIFDSSGSQYGINILNSTSDNNYLIGNEISGAGFTAKINDSGTNTTIQHRDQFDLNNVALTSGNIFDLNFATSTTATAAMTALDIDLTNLTADGSNAAYGIHINDFAATTGSTEYGLFIEGTNYDFGLYVQDDVYFGADATIAGGDLFLTPQASSGSTTEGTIYYDSDDDQLKVYANGKWQSDRTTATLIVAANDSQNKEKADYVGDGTGDDEQIEDAIAALPAGGGVIVLLEGTYSIGDGVGTPKDCSIENGIDITKSNVSLIGAGRSTILQRGCDAATDDGVITVGDGGTTAVFGVTIADLAIDGVQATYTGSTNQGILFNKKVTSSTIRNIYVHDIGAEGIFLKGSSGNENTDNIITENELKDIDGGNWGGIVAFTSNDNIISNNNIDNVGSGSIRLVSTSLRNIVSGNIIQNSNSSGITLQTGSDESIVINNVINELVSHGIICNSSDNNIISSNRIHDTTSSSDGMNLNSTCDNNYIIGNEITGGFSNKISDAGTGTTIQHRDQFDLNNVALTSGNIFDLNFATSTTATAAMTALDIDLTNLTADGTNAAYGLHINDFAATTGSTEYGLFIEGTNYDYSLYVQDDVYFDTSNANGVSIVSDLSGGARSTNVLSITQANDATNNSTGNLLQLTNSDTGSTAALLSISQVTTGTGIEIDGITTGFGISVGTSIGGFVTSGIGINIPAFNVTSGNALLIDGGNAGSTTALTGDYLKIRPTRTITTSGITDTGNFLEVSRGNTINSGADTYAISGDLVTFFSTCTETSGTCTDTSNILSLAQNYASASGAVIDIINAGTGAGILFEEGTTVADGIQFGTDANLVTLYRSADDVLATGDAFGVGAFASSASTTEGTIYYDSDDDQLKVYANGKWQSDRTTATLIVAANDSQNKEKADYVGDGTGDDEQIEDAIAALPAGGGVIVLLEGTYSIGDGVGTPKDCSIEDGIDIIKSNVSIIGAGRSTILQRGCDTTSNDGVITVGDGGTTSVSGVTIADLAIDGVKATYTADFNYGILFNQKVSQSRIENNWIYNNEVNGIYLLAVASTTTHNTNNLIKGNNINSNGSVNNFSKHDGIQIEYSDNNVISHNIIQLNAATGIDMQDANNNIITLNNIQSSRIGISIGRSVSNTVSNNNLESMSDYGITMATSSHRNSIVGNTIYEVGSGSGDRAIQLANNADDNLIAFNLLYDSSGSPVGISISSDSDNNYIVGNKFAGTWDTRIDDLGTNTTIQHRDQFDLNNVALTSGNIFDLNFATSTTATAAMTALDIDLTNLTADGSNAAYGIHINDFAGVTGSTEYGLFIEGTNYDYSLYVQDDVYFDTSNANGVSIVSDLSGGARSTDVLSITQANDATNNSTGNLLQLTNGDAGSTTAVLDISTMAIGTGARILFGQSEASGIALSIITGSISSGTGISLLRSVSSPGYDFSGKYISIDSNVTANNAVTRDDTGNFISATRLVTTSNASADFTISGDLVTFSSSGTQTAGTLTDTANILQLAQNYASASGAVLNILNAGTGAGILFEEGTTVVDGIQWGADANLVTLYRSADDVLATGDAFGVGALASSASTTEGTIYYDSDDDQLKVYANGKWQSDRTTATLIVAANDSQNKEKADYVGDGTGDDEQIEDAIAALPAGGGVIVLLEGTYSIGDGVGTPKDCSIEDGIDIIKSNVSLIGAGRSTILQRGCDITSNYGVIIVGDGGTTAVSGVTIADLAIDGLKATYIGFENTGILFNDQVTYSTIRNTYIHDNDGRGIYLGLGVSAANTNNLIEGNDIRSNDQENIYVQYSDNNIISNNNIESSVTYGIHIGNSNNNIVKGNFLNSNSFRGIYFVNSDKNTLSNNKIISSGIHGIWLDNADENVVVGNTIDEVGGSDDGINITNTSSNNIISLNRIIDASGSAYGINIDNSNASNNYLIGNEISGAGFTAEINDAGTGTTIQHRDQFDLNNVALTSGNIFDLNFATSTTATAAMTAFDIDLTNLTADGTNAAYGIHINDFAGVTGSTEYGIFIEGTNYDYGLYSDDDVFFGASLDVEGQFSVGTQATFVSADATPDVSGGSSFIANTGVITITDFDADAGTLENGQIFFLEFVDGNTTIDCDGGNINCGTTDIVAAAGDIGTFFYDGTDWHLVAYMDDSQDQGAGSGFDIAEWFPASQELAAGDVVSLDPEKSTYVRKSTEAYDPKLMGIVSSQPGLTLGGPIEGFASLVALAGRVPVKVIGENGTIEPGDYLTSSSTPGYAMKATQAGIVLGMALESFGDEELNTGFDQTGIVTVFINPGFWMPPAQSALLNAGEFTLEGESSFITDTNPSLDMLSRLTSDIISALKNAVLEVGTLLASLVKTERLEVTSPYGITIYDTVTGEPRCVVSENGELVSLAGTCEDVDLTDANLPASTGESEAGQIDTNDTNNTEPEEATQEQTESEATPVEDSSADVSAEAEGEEEDLAEGEEPTPTEEPSAEEPPVEPAPNEVEEEFSTEPPVTEPVVEESPVEEEPVVQESFLNE